LLKHAVKVLLSLLGLMFHLDPIRNFLPATRASLNLSIPLYSGLMFYMNGFLIILRSNLNSLQF